MEPKTNMHHHHILSTRTVLAIGLALYFLTGVTVWIAGVDLGRFNFAIAMAVASTKALLVALFFMNLKYDRLENGMIFGASFVFLAIFIVLTGTDLFFRGDIAVKGPLMASQSGPKVSKPWVSTSELISHGKEVFAVQCVSCHGAEGKGNGPAAAALNPPPRNFALDQGWKNGRKPTQVFKTLKEGIPGSGMASFATLPADERWALVHYVLTLGSKPPSDTPNDFAAIGLDPTKETAEAKEAPTIPIGFAMEQMEVSPVPVRPSVARMESIPLRSSHPGGSQLYEARCAECHGMKGEGGIRVGNVGLNPLDPVVTSAFSKQSEYLQSEAAFNRIVLQGLPGTLMPGQGSLTSSELHELYQVVNSLAAKSGQ